MSIKKIKTTLSLTSLLLASSVIVSTEASQGSEMRNNWIAQANNCREVNVDTYLNVRSSPNGAVIGRLEDEIQVTMENRVGTEWVKIQHPVAGYVSSQYLVYCSNDYAATEPEATNTPVAVAVPTEAENISTVPNSNCRQVTRNNLPVRNEPEGQLVGRLPLNQQVFMANEGFNGWVPIEAPINGYVPAEYLTACTGNTADLSTANSEPLATVDGTNCRLVMSPDVPLRAEPMGNIIGTLNKNERVYIANEGFDGWVPIESPASGYVTAANLGQCVPAQ